MAPRLASAARSSLLTAALLASPAAEAPAARVPPPDPAVVASLFDDACWQGLRSPEAFRRAVQGSPLRFRRVENYPAAERYGGLRTGVDYLANISCTIRTDFDTLEAAEDVFERVSGLTALPVSAVPAGDPGSVRTDLSAERPVSGGRMRIVGTITPPPQTRRVRMYPPGFALSISAYFTPDE